MSTHPHFTYQFINHDIEDEPNVQVLRYRGNYLHPRKSQMWEIWDDDLQEFFHWRVIEVSHLNEHHLVIGLRKWEE